MTKWSFAPWSATEPPSIRRAAAVEGTAVGFQVGVNDYLYGTRFMSYLALTLARKLVQCRRDKGAARPVTPVQFKKVFKPEQLGEVWNQWIGWEHDFQAANLARSASTP